METKRNICQTVNSTSFAEPVAKALEIKIYRKIPGIEVSDVGAV